MVQNQKHQDISTVDHPHTQIDPPSSNIILIILIFIIIAQLFAAIYYLFQYQNIKNKLSQSQATPVFLPQQEATFPTSVTSSDWKTYQNPAYLYHLKYPDGWHVYEPSLAQVYFSNFDMNDKNYPNQGNNAYIIIRLVLENHHFSTLEEWLEDWKESCSNYPCPFAYPTKTEKTSIGSLEAVKIDNTVFKNILDGKSYAYYVIEGKNLYEISVYLNKNQEKNQTINQILFTFDPLDRKKEDLILPKTNNNVTENWVSARNFRYPENWSLWGENWYLSVRQDGDKAKALDIFYQDKITDLKNYLNNLYPPPTKINPIIINNLEGFIVLNPYSAIDYEVYLQTKTEVIKLIVRRDLPKQTKETISLIIGTFHER